jgi:hypothetical protein
MSMPSDPEDTQAMFQRLTGSLPPGFKQVMDAYAAQMAQQQEMGQIDMRMQATALHEYFILLVSAGFTESQSLYYLAKLTPGL